MAINYKIFIMDDFDWNHCFSSKQDIVERIRHVAPDGCTLAVIADIPNMLILDSGISTPRNVERWLRQAVIPFDALYYQQDAESEIVLLPEEF